MIVPLFNYMDHRGAVQVIIFNTIGGGIVDILIQVFDQAAIVVVGIIGSTVGLGAA